MRWTTERVELLKKRWADGRSAGEIAAELGGVTRSAVIGKARRLGLNGRVKNPGPHKRKRRASTPQTSQPAIHDNTAPEPAYEIASPEQELTDVHIPFDQGCTLFELTEDTCRWPVGDPMTPEFHFCGGKPLGTLPYCARHARVAYLQPAADQRRAPSQEL